MSDTITVIELQDWTHYTITRILRDGTVLSKIEYTAETWPFVRMPAPRPADVLFGGITLHTDPEMTPDRIEFRARDGEVLATITNLAPPVEAGPLLHMALCSDASLCQEPLIEVSPGYKVCRSCRLWEGARNRARRKATES